MTVVKFIAIFFTIIMVTGCTSIAPQYQSNSSNISSLKGMDILPAKSGVFIAHEDANSLVLRGGEMLSPYNNSYAEYLREALEEDLKQSGHWDVNSNITISGELTKNEVEAGASIGESEISAKFIVSKDSDVVYEKSHSIHHEWESSFVGAIAKPNALNNYPISIQKLLNAFFSDKDLLAILKKQ